jgi:hypothetical protein
MSQRHKDRAQVQAQLRAKERENAERSDADMQKQLRQIERVP